MLFRQNSPKYTHFANWVSDGNPPIDIPNFMKIHPKGRHIYVYHYILSNPTGCRYYVFTWWGRICPDEIRAMSDKSSTRWTYWRHTREILMVNIKFCFNWYIILQNRIYVQLIMTTPVPVSCVSSWRTMVSCQQGNLQSKWNRPSMKWCEEEMMCVV